MDRLDGATYADDPLIGWTTVDESTEAWVPDRIVDRMRHLGSAYEMHLLPLLPGVEPVVLNSTQVRNLIEEIDWVLERGDDPVLRNAVHDLGPVLSAALRGDGLRIE